MDNEAKIQEILDQQSLYPELPRKNRVERRRDLEEWYDNYHEVNSSYNLYGLDVVDFRQPNDFLDNGIFRAERYKANSTFYPFGSRYPYDYSVILRDKRLFDAYYSRLIPNMMPQTYGYIVQGELLAWDDGRLLEVEEFCSRHEGERLAIKQTFGCHGANLLSCTICEGKVEKDGRRIPFDELVAQISPLGGSMWVIQKWLSQHVVMAGFNESSINTLRMVTYCTGERVHISKASLLAGPKGSLINNPEEGSETLYGVSLEGTVSDMAYQFATCTKSKTQHAGEKIPFFDAVCELVRTAHSYLPEVFSVGWDVVVGEDGPILLEGNDGWSPRAVQFPNQEGERKTWNRCLEERKKAFRS